MQIETNPRRLMHLTGIASEMGKDNMSYGYSSLLALMVSSECSYPGKRTEEIKALADKWIAYTIDMTGDLCQDDLGSLFRAVASAYNGLADNLRDESHECTVNR